MNHSTRCRPVLPLLCVLLAPLVPASAAAGEPEGHVQLPLGEYGTLLAARDRGPAPAGYALGNASVTVDVPPPQERAGASVEVELTIEVIDNGPVRVPVLPLGTPVEIAAVGGRPVALATSTEGLVWGATRPGAHVMRLSYRADPAPSASGTVVRVPLPEASATRLTATLPGTGLEVSVVPSAGMRAARTDASTTTVTATIPASRNVQISWNRPDRRRYTISRGTYDGRLTGTGAVWAGEFTVELFTDDPVTVPLLSRDVALRGLEVDGKQAPVLIENDRFATLVQGRGRHAIATRFEVTVDDRNGPPGFRLRIPPIPISRFELALPGKKELAVTPPSSVYARETATETVATVHVPLTEWIEFRWSEAVPGEIRAEARSNAVIYHTARASEGVLDLRAIVAYEVTRGETTRIELEIPPAVQINRVDSPSGAVADWRVGERREDRRRPLTVFLDRKVRGPLTLDVRYDVSLPARTATEGFDLPLLRAAAAHRQRGMVALLADRERTLQPLESEAAIPVGENQLPEFVREGLDATVAHTLKYGDPPPRVRTRVAIPHREEGRFDARVDTLISLGEATLQGSSGVTVHVKSGALDALLLELPERVNLLSLTAPALRTYRVRSVDSAQAVNVEFTREMEGQFRIDLGYERILVDGRPLTEVPVPAVRGAEVGQGRIAVEALTAVEVRTAEARSLSQLDPSELPRQLVLKTTNPILLAYQYVRTEEPPRLALEVTRHKVLEVQEAAIDRAEYRTLYTGDGLLVTSARFLMRNSRKQFLRVELPAGSEVWSATVAGQPEKPAIAAAGTAGAGSSVLIRIIHQTDGFPVELVFATSGPPLGRSGTIEGELPRPDVLATYSRWEVFLPEGPRYGRPSGNLVAVAETHPGDDPGSPGSGTTSWPSAVEASGGSRAPLKISVPATGTRFAFEKLYANQSDQRVGFSIPYRRPRR